MIMTSSACDTQNKTDCRLCHDFHEFMDWVQSMTHNTSTFRFQDETRNRGMRTFGKHGCSVFSAGNCTSSIRILKSIFVGT